MMSLLWYYRPEHLQGSRSPSMHEVSCLAAGGRGMESMVWGSSLAGLVPGLVTWDTREPGEGQEL